jgi:hypothetical protein
LFGWVGDGGCNNLGKIRGERLMLALELLRWSTPLLVVHLIIHPVAEEIHFLRGQFH